MALEGSDTSLHRQNSATSEDHTKMVGGVRDGDTSGQAPLQRGLGRTRTLTPLCSRPSPDLRPGFDWLKFDVEEE